MVRPALKIKGWTEPYLIKLPRSFHGATDAALEPSPKIMSLLTSCQILLWPLSLQLMFMYEEDIYIQGIWKLEWRIIYVNILILWCYWRTICYTCKLAVRSFIRLWIIPQHAASDRKVLKILWKTWKIKVQAKILFNGFRMDDGHHFIVSFVAYNRRWTHLSLPMKLSPPRDRSVGSMEMR